MKALLKNQRGFTLIELLIVVAIIGILAAIAIPNLINAMQRAKQKRTLADIRTIATAWESYAIDNDRYTAAGFLVSYPSLSGKLSPDYIKNLPENDGWGNPYLFLVTTPGTDYLIASWGKDGVPEQSRNLGPTTEFNCDIIFMTGSFIEYPEGGQGLPTAPPPANDEGGPLDELSGL